MSRSIHTTRKDIERLMRSEYADESIRQRDLEQMKDALSTKRRMKQHRTTAVGLSHTDVQNVRVEVVDQGEFLHYPASPKDICAVISQLPGGVIDGLQSIELRLGILPPHDVLGGNEKLVEGDPDPYIGRLGTEYLPGVYVGKYLGCYQPEHAAIWLLAFVYDAKSLPNRSMWEMYLRLLALRTLLHEVAHHFDHTQRVARRRWRADDVEKNEWYADHMEHRWTREIAIPYLEQQYPDDVQAFADWTAHYGGKAIPLESVITEPCTIKHGTRRQNINDAIWPMSMFIENLLKDVSAGKTLRETRREFANGLHYRDDFDSALAIVQELLATDHDDIEALALQADILVHQECYELAEQVAMTALGKDPRCENALSALAALYKARRDGEQLLRTLDSLIALRDSEKAIPRLMQIRRARAYLFLGNKVEFEKVLHECLPPEGKPIPFLVRRLMEDAEAVFGEGK